MCVCVWERESDGIKPMDWVGLWTHWLNPTLGTHKTLFSLSFSLSTSVFPALIVPPHVALFISGSQRKQLAEI